MRFSSVLKLGTFPLTCYFMFVKFLFMVEIDCKGRDILFDDDY